MQIETTFWIIYNEFRKKLWCKTQLIEFIDDINTLTMANKRIALSWTFHAFDKVNRSLRIDKLQHCGIIWKPNIAVSEAFFLKEPIEFW